MFMTLNVRKRSVLLFGKPKVDVGRPGLNATIDPNVETPMVDPSHGPLSFRVGSVEIPDALNRNELVTRVGRNQVKLALFDQWAGSLKQNVYRVLAENLSILLSTDRVVHHTFRTSMPVDYQVRVEVFQFDGKPGESVVLVARLIQYMKVNRQCENAVKGNS